MRELGGHFLSGAVPVDGKKGVIKKTQSLSAGRKQTARASKCKSAKKIPKGFI